MSSASSSLAKEQSPQILIVEDEKIIARDIRLMLEDLGYSVAGIASSAYEAITLAAEKRCDLVLMDIRIRGELDGVETAARLIQLYRIPVVYVTAHTDDITLNRAKETEPFGYIAKPITQQDLKIAISMALARYQAQRDVEKREEWLRGVLHSTAEAMIITDHEGRIAFLNRAAERLTGSDNEMAFGRSIDDVLPIQEKEGVQPITPFLGGDLYEPQILLGKIVKPDEKTTQVLISIASLNRGGDHSSVVIIHDISTIWEHQKNLERKNSELETSNEKLTLLSYSLTHDLKEPLRTASIYSEILQRENHDFVNEDAQAMLSGIKQACVRMGTVMNSLVEYFRASNLDESEQQPVDASDALRDAQANLAFAISDSGARIEVDPLPLVRAHPIALVLVFQNLLGNALKYADREAPTIRVSAKLNGDFWTFQVADDGKGFDPSQAQRIFELFQRAHGREKPGSGIGLATCQRLIQHHGGQIWAESTPGLGATFYFTLPAGSASDAGFDSGATDTE